MRILIEIQTWIGDSVMATPAIENLINYYRNSEFTIIGSKESIQLFALHPRINNSYVLKKQYKSLYEFAKKIGEQVNDILPTEVGETILKKSKNPKSKEVLDFVEKTKQKYFLT